MNYARPSPCSITPEQERLWSDTRVALMWDAPAFAHIFFTMLNTVNSKHLAMFTKDVPIAATDGSSLMLNPDTFFKYSLKKRVFIVAHEIMHCIFNHPSIMLKLQMRGKVAYPDGLELPYEHKLMNVALDLVINDGLIESKLGEYDKDWLHKPDLVTHKDSGLDAYRKIFEDSKGGKGGGAGGSNAKGNQFDQHLQPGASQGQDPVTASQGRNEAEWQTAIQQAVNTARLQGKLPGSLARMFEEILNPQVDWKDKIETLFARRLGTGTFDWRKPDRRLITRDIYSPGRAGYGADTVVVAADTSGSIGDKELDMFFAEMAGILEDVQPRRLFIVWCDAAVHRVDLCDEPSDLNVLRADGAPGGGGTSFIPVFDWISEQGFEPDALVYLTDGYGSFPSEAPTYPVIWGDIGGTQYPFGDAVEIPKQIA